MNRARIFPAARSGYLLHYAGTGYRDVRCDRVGGDIGRRANVSLVGAIAKDELHERRTLSIQSGGGYIFVEIELAINSVWAVGD